MYCFSLAPGIRFNDSLFSEPIPIGLWQPPACAGIVVILTRNPHWAPKPLQPLYFGAFGNGAMRDVALPAAAMRSDLLVAALPMPFSTASQRGALCDALVEAHSPACQTNASRNTNAELARRISELEARQQEQNEQILSLLSFLGKMFAPQPIAPRRPIGFLPDLAAATETGN
jgi:hypothetical protein